MRVDILGVMIDKLTMDQTVALVKQYIRCREPLHLMGVNADKINIAVKDREMRGLINECGVVNADGASVILASRFLGRPLPERVAGIDLMQELISLSEKEHYRIYLLGAKEEVIQKTAQILKKQYPLLQICGLRNGYFIDEEWAGIAEDLRKKDPHIVFIGITSPKKEYLIQYFQAQDIRSVFMGVGGSFDVISGMIPRAPMWMRKIHMEWFFRLICEPRRMWKRYLIGNSVFLFRLLKEKLSGSKV